jgi:serine protease
MRIRSLLPAAAFFLALTAPTAAGAPSFAPGRVVVRYKSTATHAQRLSTLRATGTRTTAALPGGARTLEIKDGDSVAHTVAELRAQPDVAYAVPDYRIQAAGAPTFNPNDPGRGGPGDWRKLQWNFADKFGIHAPRAWATMRALHADGGRGVTVAVIDSGVAYTDHGSFRRAPDLYKGRFRDGHDFIDGDNYPLDEDSHGTHVTGTIAEHVNNKLAVTGLAYGVTIMPLRVLNSKGGGNGTTFSEAIMYAAQHGAKVINMSVQFDNSLRARDVPEVIDALRYAHKHGVVMVGVAGNQSENHIAYPARDANVISVGATTISGCMAEYSNTGDGLDVMAPGGGTDAPLSGNNWDRAHCGSGPTPRNIWQETFVSNPRDFHLVGFEGTSEAAPHVSAIAALVIASKRLGSNPSPGAVQKRIQSTARDLGASGYDKHYGYGLVDAARAVAP